MACAGGGSPVDKLYIVQGYMLIGPRTAAGGPARQWWAGNVSEATLELSEGNYRKYQTFNGIQTMPSLAPGNVAGRLVGLFDQWNTRNLALGLYANAASASAGTVTNEPLPVGLQHGDIVSLAHPYATAVTFRTASGAALPATMFRRFAHNNRAYQVAGDTGGLAQPFTASYSYAGHEVVENFTRRPDDAYVVLDGINAVSKQPVLIDVYLTRFDPFPALGLIDSSMRTLAFSADVIVDPLNFDSSDQGGVFRMRRKAAA